MFADFPLVPIAIRTSFFRLQDALGLCAVENSLDPFQIHGSNPKLYIKRTGHKLVKRGGWLRSDLTGRFEAV